MKKGAQVYKSRLGLWGVCGCLTLPRTTVQMQIAPLQVVLVLAFGVCVCVRAFLGYQVLAFPQCPPFRQPSLNAGSPESKAATPEGSCLQEAVGVRFAF